jgi:quercetin dioxygenase-like cupin family protein
VDVNRLWIFLLIVLVGAAAAQDPTKVEPKHYKLAFENEHVQVVYVHYGPHEKAGLHDHPAGVVVNVTAGHLRFTDENGQTQEKTAEPGEARWFPPHKHKVENLGDTSYNAVYIGIKSAAHKSAAMDQTPKLDEETKAILNTLLVSAKPQK